MYKTLSQNGPSLKGPSLNDLSHHYMIQANIMSSSMMHQKKKKEKEISNKQFFNSTKPLMNHTSY